MASMWSVWTPLNVFLAQLQHTSSAAGPEESSLVSTLWTLVLCHVTLLWCFHVFGPLELLLCVITASHCLHRHQKHDVGRNNVDPVETHEPGFMM